MAPSLGLILTSFGFFIPAWIARRRKQKTDAVLISSLATSSILYHGTLHPRAHLFDLIVAHSVALNYFMIGIKNIIKYRNKLDVFGLLCGGLSTHLYYMKSVPTRDENISRKWHMKVHMTAQMALIAFIFGSQSKYKLQHQNPQIILE